MGAGRAGEHTLLANVTHIDPFGDQKAHVGKLDVEQTEMLLASLDSVGFRSLGVLGLYWLGLEVMGRLEPAPELLGENVGGANAGIGLVEGTPLCGAQLQPAAFVLGQGSPVAQHFHQEFGQLGPVLGPAHLAHLGTVSGQLRSLLCRANLPRIAALAGAPTVQTALGSSELLYFDAKGLGSLRLRGAWGQLRGQLARRRRSRLGQLCRRIWGRLKNGHVGQTLAVGVGPGADRQLGGVVAFGVKFSFFQLLIDAKSGAWRGLRRADRERCVPDFCTLG